jgi:hypothetical protein
MACSGLAEPRVAFAVAERDFDWSDLVVAARWWGDWSRIAHDANSALLSIERARASGLVLDGPEFDAEAHRFRYARHLLSADELERWLAERGLDVPRWFDYVRGVVLSGPPEGSRPALASGSVAPDALWTHAICSGALGRVASRLANRTAVAVAAGESLPAGRLSGAQVGELDLGFDRFCARSAHTSALIRALDRHREAWTHVDLRWLVTPDLHVAREVALGVRVDGRTLAEVADHAGLACARRRLVLEQVEEPLRASLLGAGRGELIGPLSMAGAHAVVEVLDRRAPSLDQPHVAERARRAAIERAVEREIAERVTWHERP